jgi:hypothetical protein
MRSLRLVGLTFSAIATMAAHAAPAQTSADACGPWGTTPAFAARGSDCQTNDAARVGAELLFGGLFGRSMDASSLRSTTGPNLGIEYFSGGSSLDVFRTALTGSASQSASNSDDLLTSVMSQTAATLFWEGLLAAGPQTWLDIGRSEAVSAFASFAGVEGLAHPPTIFVQAVTPTSPVFGNGPSNPTANGQFDDRPDQPGVVQSPVSSTPEPASIALIATGLAGLGATKLRWRRRG